MVPEDYHEYCITAPVDSRLPSGGNEICGLYDLALDKVGLQKETNDGIDVTLGARLPNGVRLLGGVSSERVTQLDIRLGKTVQLR